MKSKNIVTAILLAFVVVSVAVLIVRESRSPVEPSSSALSVAVTEPVTAAGAVSEQGDIKSSPLSSSEQGTKIPAETGSSPAKTVPAKPAASNRGAGQIANSPKVIVYYFHGNTRCITCKKIESFAKSAIENGFAAELKTGQIEFRAVNVEEPNNEHYVQDYQLATRSVVLSRLRNEKQDTWKNLDQVWTLVRNQEAFERYVVDETKQLLGGV